MSVPLYWRMQKDKYDKIKEHISEGKGNIISYTIIYAAPDGFESPYIISIVEMKNGGKLAGELTGIDIQNISGINLIGKEVKIIFRKLKKERNGLCVYGYKFLLEN